MAGCSFAEYETSFQWDKLRGSEGSSDVVLCTNSLSGTSSRSHSAHMWKWTCDFLSNSLDTAYKGAYKGKKLRYAPGGAYIGMAPILETI